MKKALLLSSFVLLFCATSVSFAQNGPVFLGPATGDPAINPIVQGSVTPVAEGVIEPIPAGTVSLYHCVRVKDPHHIHPCAVPTIVQIADPCPPACGSCNSCCQCAPACVNVQICVPPCGCPKIKTRDGGRYVKYDYGKYRVEIRSRKGVVTVDYDD